MPDIKHANSVCSTMVHKFVLDKVDNKHLGVDACYKLCQKTTGCTEFAIGKDHPSVEGDCVMYKPGCSYSESQYWDVYVSPKENKDFHESDEGTNGSAQEGGSNWLLIAIILGLCCCFVIFFVVKRDKEEEKHENKPDPSSEAEKTDNFERYKEPNNFGWLA